MYNIQYLYNILCNKGRSIHCMLTDVVSLAGAPSSAMVKRLKYVGQCLEELSSLGITGADDTNPAASYITLASRVTLRPVVSPEAVKAGRKFQHQFLRELPGLMVRPGEALRHHLAWYRPLT